MCTIQFVFNRLLVKHVKYANAWFQSRKLQKIICNVIFNKRVNKTGLINPVTDRSWIGKFNYYGESTTEGLFICHTGELCIAR